MENKFKKIVSYSLCCIDVRLFLNSYPLYLTSFWCQLVHIKKLKRILVFNNLNTYPYLHWWIFMFIFSTLVALIHDYIFNHCKIAQLRWGKKPFWKWWQYICEQFSQIFRESRYRQKFNKWRENIYIFQDSGSSEPQCYYLIQSFNKNEYQ